ncbi:hypothetical protein VPHD148_0014 [Vibrio phage D148]
MASIFEVIEGLTVDQEDIIEAELFAEQYLSAQFPTYDFRQGTALRDMTVRPNATLLALIAKATRQYFDDTDILNITNDTDSEVVDKRLSNFFITRKSGDKSVVSARLFFTFPTNTPITTIVPVSAYFSVDNETKFYPRGNVTVYDNSTSGEYYFKYDSSSDQWYVDMELESESPSEDANLEDGDLLYFTVFSPYFLRAQIQYLVSKAIEEETNEEMVDRSYSAVSTRNLINTPSIVARIGDQFNYAKTVYPVGLGSEWLFRDLIDITDAQGSGEIFTYHRGGHTDVYLETDPIVQTAQLTAVADPQGIYDAAFVVSGPIYEIKRSDTPPAGLDEDTMPIYATPGDPSSGFAPYTYSVLNGTPYDSDSIPEIPSQDIGLSADQQTVIQVGTSLSIGDTATFSFSVFQGVGSIDDSMHSEEERVVCADYLARSFEPIFIDISVDTRGAQVSDRSTPYSALEEYVESIPNGGTIYVSEIINILIENGIKDIKLPLEVSGVRYSREVTGDRDGNTNTVSTSIEDQFPLNSIQKFYLRDVDYNEV